MAERELSILVRAKGALQAARDIGGVNHAVGTLGKTASIAGKGVGTAIGNIAKIGVVAGAGLGAAVASGIADLATLETAITSVDGAIKQVGQTGKVSGAQVADWANQIESDIGAAFDDKDITKATTTLIRFGAVTPPNLRKAMTVMTDLAAKTGSVDSAASLLAKALADPEKAAGKLARTGVVLTKAQQDQIKAFVEAGKVGQAQALILDLIAKKTKGAAAATQGPYARALSVLQDSAEDAKKALAIGFLPVIERVADVLKKKLADPNTLKQIESFGRGLADAFSKVLDFAERVPWDQVAEAMKIAGMGGKALLDAFVALPPWVQTAVITGWGLNKLTGGAVSGIIGQLGSGLIKGVLGMNAGVVNINAGVVNGAGGPAGAAGAAASGATGLLGGLGSLITKAVGAGLIAAGVAGITAGTSMGGPQGAAVAAGGAAAGIGGAAILLGPIGAIAASVGAVGITLGQVRDNSAHMGAGIATSIQTQIAGGAKLSDLKQSLAAVDQGINDIQANPLNVLVAGDALDNLRAQRALLARQVSEAQKDADSNATGLRNVGAALGLVKSGVDADKAASVAAAARTAAAATSAGFKAKEGGLAAARAINAKKLSVQLKTVIPVTNNVAVSGRDIVHQQTTFSRSGGVLNVS